MDERLRWEVAILTLLLIVAGVLAVIWLELGFDISNGETTVHLKGLVGVAVLAIAGRLAWHARPNKLAIGMLWGLAVLAALGLLGTAAFFLV